MDRDLTFFLEMKMMTVYLLQPFTIKQIRGEKYYVYEFDAFDQIGIYKMSIVHNQKGYFMDQPEQRQIIIREYFQSEEKELFFSHQFYMIVLFAVTVSFLHLLFRILNDKSVE